jgi:hypothetical protein
MHNPEISSSQEASGKQPEAAAERSIELARSRENHQESGIERKNRIESARRTANHEAVAGKERPATEHKSGGEPSTPLLPKSNKERRSEAYRSTLTNIQRDMDLPTRTYSKLIHSPAVEKSADVIGSTIARPKSILYGSFTALVAISLLYVAAKHFGYSLSGFETIAAFLIGWLVGLSYEAVQSVIKH